MTQQQIIAQARPVAVPTVKAQQLAEILENTQACPDGACGHQYDVPSYYSPSTSDFTQQAYNTYGPSSSRCRRGIRGL